MSQRRFDLPPLDTLEAFEAAARHLSFTRAGDELALTQSAISRQIKLLEDRLGVVLFRRLHRSLELTDDGRVLERATSTALEQLDRACIELRRADRVRPIVVATTPGFAGLWLIPRISGFSASRPHVDVRISAGNALSNLARDGVDVAIRYLPVDGVPAGALRLFGDVVFPVCSPRLLRDPARPLAEPDHLRQHVLLLAEPDGGNHLQDWPLWLHAMKLPELRPASVLHFSSYDQLIHAAIAGQGVALGKSPLIDRFLKEKKLVTPFRREVASARSYYMLLSEAGAAKPEVREFADWLTEEARLSETAAAPSAVARKRAPTGPRVRPRAPD
ncbi:LysR substrate-binding domain-containing protein [Piscinibacter koreensis]|uniref:LysR family transcriptional regulator n=1 Tax=Piscinibacter koreensis TaxID=2742824 RepID=A0A7Y6TYI7_9BURK|nr:LysR substrate-binding domain-containing protein [Schlegelella koreensis]NUZ08147.1 LysR family transcriptional regulator [Schlegelella koreensis]